MNKSLVTVALCIVLTTLSLKSNAAKFSFYALDIKPAAYVDDRGITRGFHADTMRRVAEELGQSDIKIKIAPYPRILNALNENTSGFVITCLFPSGKFNEKVHQPHKVAHFNTGVISMASNPFTWKNAPGKTVATVKGASKVYGKKLHSKVESGEINLVSVTDYGQAMRMLKAGRINGFAGNIELLLYKTKAEDLPIADPAIITEKISKMTVSIAPGIPDGEATVEKIREILARLWEAGETQAIVEKYLPFAPQPK